MNLKQTHTHTLKQKQTKQRNCKRQYVETRWGQSASRKIRRTTRQNRFATQGLSSLCFSRQRCHIKKRFRAQLHPLQGTVLTTFGNMSKSSTDHVRANMLLTYFFIFSFCLACSRFFFFFFTLSRTYPFGIFDKFMTLSVHVALVLLPPLCFALTVCSNVHVSWPSCVPRLHRSYVTLNGHKFFLVASAGLFGTQTDLILLRWRFLVQCF